jgi:nicotinamide-nucleotide amidase
VQAILAGASELRQQTLRLWGVPESELAATLRRSDGDLAGLEITTCLRAGELEIVTRYPPAADAAQQRLVAAVRKDFPDQLFSEGPTIDDLIRVELQDRGWTGAVVETITGGTLAARLAGIAGSPRFAGGIVASSESVLTEVVGVPAELIKGSNAPEVARAMAERARVVFGADIGIAIGPSGLPGGSPASIELCVITPEGPFTRSLSLAGPTDILRARIIPVVLHLLHQALTRQ